jgi:hypothetical protein
MGPFGAKAGELSEKGMTNRTASSVLRSPGRVERPIRRQHAGTP